MRSHKACVAHYKQHAERLHAAQRKLDNSKAASDLIDKEKQKFDEEKEDFEGVIPPEKQRKSEKTAYTTKAGSFGNNRGAWPLKPTALRELMQNLQDYCASGNNIFPDITVNRRLKVLQMIFNCRFS